MSARRIIREFLLAEEALVSASHAFVSGNREFALTLPAIMGIVNVTPDSFSGDGVVCSPYEAIARAIHMVEDGASLIDIGGESTRPGSQPISVKEELSRVLPIVEELVSALPVPISVDTMKPEVAEACLCKGAHIINDVGGLRDGRMRDVVAKFNAPAVIMHMQGTPATMQIDPQYARVVEDIYSCLATQAKLAKMGGIEQIIVDPGIGFGKNLEHNLLLLRDLARFKDLGFPLLIGTSRKGFLGKITGRALDDRLAGTIASVTACILHGADIVRVHDVKECRDAMLIADAIKNGEQRE